MTTTHTPPSARPCGACGKGVFAPADLQGRTFPYRDELDLVLTQPLVVPACTVCGESRISDEQLEALDEALERAYVERRHAKTVQLLQALLGRKLRQIDIEQALGLSAGYVSKVLRGERTLETSTFRGLIFLAADLPGRLHDLAAHYPQFGELEKKLLKRGVLEPA